MTDEKQIDGTTHAEKNSNGDIEHKPDVVNTDSLVIGGTLYEEDANSPLSISGSSGTYTISGSYDDVIIIPMRGRENATHDQIRVNGNSTTDYRYTNESDTETTGESEWSMDRLRAYEYVTIGHEGWNDLPYMRAGHMRSNTGSTVKGQYVSAVTSLDSITLLDSGGTSQTTDARVFGRVME